MEPGLVLKCVNVDPHQLIMPVSPSPSPLSLQLLKASRPVMCVRKDVRTAVLARLHMLPLQVRACFLHACRHQAECQGQSAKGRVHGRRETYLSYPRCQRPRCQRWHSNPRRHSHCMPDFLGSQA